MREQAELGAAFAPWTVQALSPIARGEARHWKATRMSFVHLTDSHGSRFGRPALETSDNDTITLVFIHRGGVRLIRPPALSSLGQGMVLAIGPSSAVDAVSEPHTTLSALTVPVSVLSARGIETRRIDGTMWVGGPLEAAAVSLSLRMLELGHTDNEALERALTELIVSTLLRQTRTDEDDAVTLTRIRAIAVIDDHYTNAELDAAAVARRLGVSRRYLYTLFEGFPASVASLIRARRVEHADGLLMSGRDLSLRRIAELSGLGSEDRLLRTFKTVLGESPSQRRKRLRARDIA